MSDAPAARSDETARILKTRSTALDAIHEEEEIGKAFDTRLLIRLWRYVAPYKLQVFLTLSLVAPMFLVMAAPAWLIKNGIERVIAPVLDPAAAATIEPTAIDALLAPPGGVSPLWWLGGLYLALAVLGGALQYLKMLVMARTGQSAMRDLRREIFGHIQRLHIGFFDRYPVGRLVARATNDVENVAEMFSAGIVALITDLLIMAAFALVLFLVNAKLALITFSVVPFLAIAAILFRLKVREAFRLVRVRIARINAYIQENITGMKVVQLFTREKRNYDDFDEINAEHRNAWFTSIRYDALLFSSVEVAQNLCVALTIAYGSGAGIAAAGVIYVFIDYMRQFFMPLRDLSAKYSVMQSSLASCERIFQILDTEPGVADRPGALDSVNAAEGAVPVGARGGVEFQNVWFSYGDDEDWVLEDVSFSVPPGERAAFVGATGAGKTTIIKLLTRFYEPQKGRILLDGIDLRDLTQQELRRRVAMVLQDVFLFSGSVAENIALGRDDLPFETVEQAARAVEAARFIEKLPQGYETEVRERGTNFSAGQRQLLSFARALSHGADVLVLDEATSSIDTETEALVQQGIHVLMEGKTALVIAHRLSTIQDVDRIHVLHHGRLVEQGTHDELMAEGGLYAKLYRLQYATQERGETAAAAG